ncbi:MAG: hypothetical protein M3R63_14040 [Actinomycetota bacterium]|nr:hypothetical protein [Actinomycetota bacterium]
MASLQTLERRILALEARLADVEGGYGDTLYKLHRASVKADLRTAKILQRLEIPDISEEIDAVLDEQWNRTTPPALTWPGLHASQRQRRSGCGPVSAPRRWPIPSDGPRPVGRILGG